MTIQALLLDAGGTLLAENPSRETLYAQAAARHGIALEPAGMRLCMQRAHGSLPLVLEGNYRYSMPWFEAFIADIFERQLGLERARLPRVCEELFATFADARSFRLLPGAAVLLEAAAARGLKLGLISNWSPALSTVLDGLGVLGRFDTVLISSVERLEKPDRLIFERALQRLNVRAEQTLHVGNEPVQDVQGANDCGIRALLYDPEIRHAALDCQSIRRLDEIIPWIKDQR